MDAPSIRMRMDKTSQIQAKLFLDWLSKYYSIEPRCEDDQTLRARIRRSNLRLVTKEDEMKKLYEGNSYQGKEMKSREKVKVVIKKTLPATAVKRTKRRCGEK